MVWSTEGGFLATWDTVDGELAGQPRVGVREGFEYRVQAARPAPSFEQLSTVTYDAATLERWTQLPREYPGSASWPRRCSPSTAPRPPSSGRSPCRTGSPATGGFTYDLDVPALRGDDALERFVLEDRVGYCEYFATGMAVMLREAGIPARVAVGFLPGRVTDEADPEAGRELTEFTVSTRDAHAWVEVLFPGFGWVTFEPTPRDDQTQIMPSADDLTPVENERERLARELEEARQEAEDDPSTPEDRDAPTPPEMQLPEEPEATAPGAGSVDGRARPRAGRWRVPRRRRAARGAAAVSRRRHPRLGHGDATHRVLVAQRHLLATAADHGVGRRAAETTPEVVARWHDEGRVDDRGRPVRCPGAGGRLRRRPRRAPGRGGRAARPRPRGAAARSVDRRDRVLAPVRVPLATVRSTARG
jgi:hypothetical protein